MDATLIKHVEDINKKLDRMIFLIEALLTLYGGTHLETALANRQIVEDINKRWAKEERG